MYKRVSLGINSRSPKHLITVSLISLHHLNSAWLLSLKSMVLKYPLTTEPSVWNTDGHRSWELGTAHGLVLQGFLGEAGNSKFPLQELPLRSPSQGKGLWCTTAHPKEGISHLGNEPRPMDPQPRFRSWFQCSELPTLGISAHGKSLCSPALTLLPGITLYLTRQKFPSSLGDMQDPLGQLLPLHPTLPLIYPLPSSWSLLHPPASPALHIWHSCPEAHFS